MRLTPLARALFATAVLASPVALLRAQKMPSTTDPRVTLSPGMYNAGEAAHNMKLVSTSRKPAALHPEMAPGGRILTWINSDLAFRGHYVFQGNFSGFEIWDVANPAKPTLVTSVVCPTDQADPSVYGNLLFISAEATRGRLDCGSAPMDTVSKDRMRGVRIFDISDLAHPKQVAAVQTCRGSHTHTLVPDPKDKGVVYVYVSGSAGIRSPNEVAGCSAALPDADPNSEHFRIEVIRVPLAHPEQAAVVSKPAILADLTHASGSRTRTVADSVDNAARMAAAGAAGRGGRGRGGRGGRGGGGRGGLPADAGPDQCHDITVYPAIGLAGGACGGYGVLLNITDPAHPTRLTAVADTNFAFWHSATFSNDGSKVIFTDEWGGGTSPKCRATDPLEWGADAIFTLKDDKLTQDAYYKLPDAQTSTENCVAHNGALVPVPGRDIMSQGWYQGGVSVFDFTNPQHPFEIASFDRGPINKDTLVIGGDWAAYYYNGYIYASELARGLDILELKPSPLLSQNEIDAAKLVRFEQFNPQMQPKLVWPAAFPVVRSYLDQLVRDKGLPAARTSALASELAAAEKMSGAARRGALEKVATGLDADIAKTSDARRVRLMASATRELAKATK